MQTQQRSGSDAGLWMTNAGPTRVAVAAMMGFLATVACAPATAPVGATRGAPVARPLPPDPPPPAPVLAHCEGVDVPPLSVRPVLPPDQARAEQASAESWDALRDGRVADAVALAEAAAAADPLSFRAAMALGVALARAARYEAALRAFCGARRLDESSRKALFWIGHTRTQSGQYVAAAEVMAELVVAEPDWADAHYELGFALARLNRFDDAIFSLTRVIELQPNHARAHYELGFAHLRRGRHAEAVAAYTRARDLRPKHVPTLRELAAALVAVGQFRAAEVEARKAVRLMPDVADGHYWLGRALLGQRRCPKAVAAFRDAVHTGAPEQREDYERWVSQALRCE